MKGLVIDTALGSCSAVVFDGHTVLASQSEPMTKGHSERIGGFVRDAVAGSGLDFADLDRIAMTIGPGSFTGLRVGLAFALGVGEAMDRPVSGISSLEALAASTDDRGGHVCAAIDARRGQIYVQTFEDGRALMSPQALSIEQAVGQLADGADWRLIGSGAPLLIDDRPGRAIDPLAAPTVIGLVRCALAADPQTHLPKPLYLRAPDATPPTRLPGQARPARTAPA